MFVSGKSDRGCHSLNRRLYGWWKQIPLPGDHPLMFNPINPLKPFLIVSVLTLFCSQMATAQTLHLTQRTFYDSGFGGRMASHTILAPSNWEVEGQGFWPNSQYYKIPPSRQITLSSPDGYGIEIAPLIVAKETRVTNSSFPYTQPQRFDSEMGAMIFPRPDTLEQWADHYRELLLPNYEGSNARLVETFEIEELTAVIEHELGPLKSKIASDNRTNRQMNFQQSCDGVAIGFRVQHQEDGRQLESLHVLLVATVYTQNQDYVTLDWNCPSDIRFTAPRGKLESALPAMVAIASSVRETPGWAREKARHLGIMNDIELKGFAERQRIMVDTQRDISRIIDETYRNQNASNDRSHRNYVNSLREVEIYSDGNMSYELPSGYEKVYGDGNGNFILTNDHMFDPNVELDTNSHWSNVEAVR